MSKSFSELFNLRKTIKTVKIPDHVGKEYDIESGTGSWVTSGIEDYREHADSYVVRPADDNTVERYKVYKTDPAAHMSLFGGLYTPSFNMSDDSANTYNTLNEFADKIGLGLPGVIPDGVIPMPGYKSYEKFDSNGNLSKSFDWMSAVESTLNSTVKSAVGGRLRPNYELLFRTQTNGDLINNTLDALTNGFFTKEFEKGRFPWQLPGIDLTTNIKSIYKTNPTQEDTGLWADVKGWVMDQVDDFLQKQDSNAIDLIGGKLELTESTAAVYGQNDGPYTTISSNTKKNLKDIMSELKEGGLLTGYKDYAGFEIGTNHNWIIRLKPYVSGSRKCLTPPLPVYVLPNLWNTESGEYSSTLPKVDGFDAVINNWTDKVVQTALNKITFGYRINDLPKDEKGIGDILTDALQTAIYGNDDNSGSSNGNLPYRFFSFGYHTPAISYDLNFGTIRTETQRLFNGSSVEIFAGMQYNATMNISILDDMYHSMYKYMIEYTNKIYDVSSGSIAPYYSMAFEIDLIILRTGNIINQEYKLIGIPIEFTPRLEGSDQPNECRVDITFGIIGLISPTNCDKPAFPDNFRRGQDTINRDGHYGVWSGDGTPPDEIKKSTTWGDVMINIGGNLKYSQD